MARGNLVEDSKRYIYKICGLENLSYTVIYVKYNKDDRYSTFPIGVPVVLRLYKVDRGL